MLCEQQSKNSFAKSQKKIIVAVPPAAKKPGKTAGLSHVVKPGQLTADALKGWASWLDAREWQLWTTLTTARELTLPGARRGINRLAGYLKQHNYPAEIFWAAEPFDLKEGYHLHCMLRFTELSLQQDNKIAYSHLVSGWRQVTGEKTARIYSERYQPDKGANHYLAKYMCKNRSDYDYINPSLQNNDDQFEDPRPFMATLQEQMKARQIEASKEAWRRVTVADLHAKGIYAGKADPEPARYENTAITFDTWETREYKKDLKAYMGKKPIIDATGNQIFVPRFTIAAMQ